MVENRPAPRYGELAPEGWVWSPPDDGSNSEPVETVDATDASPRRRMPADAVTSVLLLILGLTFESSAIPGMFRLRQAVDKFYSDRDLGEYAGGSVVDIAGAVAGSAHIALLLAAIVLTVRLIGQRRRSWPVPLLLGALAMIITFVCVALALVADPGFISGLSSS